MRKLILGLFGLVLITLPQLAGAQSSNQSFGGDYKYVAKFLCGPADVNGLGVVSGHYNTIVNVLALKNKTAFVYRSTWVSADFSECEVIDRGVPSDYSFRFNLERDEGTGLTCNDIKYLITGGGRCEGFFEGLVTIYSSRPLSVTDAITGQPQDCDGNCDVSVLQAYEVSEVKTSEKITPQVEN